MNGTVYAKELLPPVRIARSADLVVTWGIYANTAA